MEVGWISSRFWTQRWKQERETLSISHVLGAAALDLDTIQHSTFWWRKLKESRQVQHQHQFRSQNQLRRIRTLTIHPSTTTNTVIRLTSTAEGGERVDRAEEGSQMSSLTYIPPMPTSSETENRVENVYHAPPGCICRSILTGPGLVNGFKDVTLCLKTHQTRTAYIPGRSRGSSPSRCSGRVTERFGAFCSVLAAFTSCVTYRLRKG